MFYRSHVKAIFIALFALSVCACDEPSRTQDNSQTQTTSLLPTIGSDTDSGLYDAMTMESGTDYNITAGDQNTLNQFLPIPNCVAYHNGDCIIYQSQSDQVRCEQWQEVMNSPPTTTLENLNTCTLEEIPSSSLQKAEAYLNLLRSWLDLPAITMIQTVLQQQCALMSWVIHLAGSWSIRTQCYSHQLNRVRTECQYNVLGGWTSLEMLEITLSLSSIPLKLVGLERRHQYLSADLKQIYTGRYNQIESIALESQASEQAPLAFSIYPGVGTLPLELVNEGNNYRAKVPWSIALPNGVYQNFSYEVSQLGMDSTRLVVERNSSFSESNIFVFTLGQSVRPGDVYKIDMSWNEGEEDHTAQAFISFKDCGYVMPNLNCNPIEESPCSQPGYNCLPSSPTMQWICTRQGPIGLNESCQEVSACQGGMLCYMDRCRAYCDPRPNQWNSCDALCSNSSSEVIEFGNTTFGICTP